MDATDFEVEGYRYQGRVIVRSHLSPISLQARRQRLGDLKAAIREAIASATNFLMTHDIEVTLTWYATEADRYGSHTAADLDNVIKPLLDAATGPNGIMVDDNQVQSIRALWMTPGSFGPGFVLEFQSLDPAEVVAREGTVFVRFEASACYILPGDDPRAWRNLMTAYRNYAEQRRRSRDEGIHEEFIRWIAPVPRPWHSQRLTMQGFTIVDLDTQFGPV